MTILVSACLLGLPCRYDGQSVPCPALVKAAEKGVRLIPFCPEIYGGLPTPRPASERRGERVVNNLGGDVTDAYRRGAEAALALYRALGCDCALLKERSPSCGAGTIYDGTFTGALISGDGVTAELFRAAGVPVYGESRAMELWEERE